MEVKVNETLANGQNVQQPAGLTGQVNNQAAVADAIICEGVNLPTEKANRLAGQAKSMTGQAQSQTGQAQSQDDETKTPAERLAELEALRITTSTDVPPEQPSLSVDGVGFFAIGDIHAVKAKQKQGKTTALKICTAAMLRGEQMRVKSELEAPGVLWLDTEQKASDVKLIIDDIRQMTGLDDAYIDSHLRLYPLRKMNYETLMADTALLVEAHLPQVVIIDGVVDYVASFNDEMTSRQLIHDLMVMAEARACAIVCVLHENKASDDSNMLGHLGTVLAQAAGTVLECRKSKQGIITVGCSDPRHGTTPPWSFKFDAAGRIVDADTERIAAEQQTREANAKKREAERQQAEQVRLDQALKIISNSGGSIARNLLNEQLQTCFGVKRTAVSKFLTKMIAEQKLDESGGMISEPPTLF